ncbi:MAG: ROK family protein [Nevskiales bacterium]|nr:ROK family protein [Nevskiales bacterium]
MLMRIGIDLGGTKTEGIVMGAGSAILHRERVPTPQNDYRATLDVVVGLVRTLEAAAGRAGLHVGLGHPGSISPATGLMRNSNSTCLNGTPFKQDLERWLDREVRMANDADCFALSEACDGAAQGARCVFGAILGTGCGGGVVVDGKLLAGPNAIAGEWGHNPLPWPRPEWNEVPGSPCWHGGYGCLETWISGSGLADDHARVTGEKISAGEVAARAERGEERAAATLARYEDRLARALAQVVNILDPHVIVLGGGVSRVERLYRNVPALWDAWIFSDGVNTKLVPARYGDASGARGAAWLWP